MRVDDLEYVREEYATEVGLAARASIYGGGGADARDVVLQELHSAGATRLLEVGCGWGELAARMAAELGCEVVAIDQSERMVELASAHDLAELWELVGRDTSERLATFRAETGEASLERHFAVVERRDLSMEVTFADAGSVRRYVGSSSLGARYAATCPSSPRPWSHGSSSRSSSPPSREIRRAKRARW